jgi:hypothetical protein
MPTYRDQFGVVVVNDILYVIGGKDAWEYDLYSINEQYMPRGYNGPIPPVTLPIITALPNVVDEPFNQSKPSFNYAYIIAIVITSGLVVVSLFFYGNKKKNGAGKTC